MTTYLVCIFIYIVTATTDVLATEKALDAGGREQNPLIRWLVGPYPNLLELIYVKVFGLALIVAASLISINGLIGMTLGFSVGQIYATYHNYKYWQARK